MDHIVLINKYYLMVNAYFFKDIMWRISFKISKSRASFDINSCLLIVVC